MGQIPEIFMGQDMIAVEDEAERKIKDELQISLKGKIENWLRGESYKNERDLLKECILLSHPQKKFFFSLKSLKQIST